MPAIPLPVGIEEKLDEVAVEVRRLRVLRGVSWFAAVLFTLPVALVVLDAALDLAAPLRGLLLTGGLVVLAAAFWLLVLRRSRGPVPPEQLAAAVEEHHPNLAERLRTLVELSEHAEPGNGSKAMIGLLAKETEKRAKRLNFLAAAPIGFSLRLAVFAVLIALVAISPLFLVKGTTERVRRALLPWWTPPIDVPYAVRVSSGDPVVKRGEPVTLSAYLERTKPAGDLPTDATLVVRTPGQKDEKRLPMSGDDKAAFTVTRPKVEADFEYRVESGPAASEWHTVAAVDAVEVADGTTITITAPAYARDTVPAVTKDGLSEIEALQHSTAEFTFKLSRAPADVQLEFRPTDAKADQLPNNLSAKLRYSGDRKTITAAVPLAADGTLKLALFGDKGVRTDVPVAVKAVPDKAPEFEKVVGVPADKRQVKPDAVLPFEVAVTDDVAVGKAFVDLARAGGPDVPFHSEPFPLPAGQKRGEVKAGFALAGRVRLGETVRLRVRVQDTREVPEHGLTPNEVTFPAGGWATLTVVADAPPVAEQDIAAQKAKIADLLKQAAEKTKTAAEEVPQQAKKWANEKLDEVKSAEVGVNRERANRAANLLRELAKEAEVVPELRSLASAARDLAENELATAEDELRKAGTETDLKKRNEAFDKAGKALAEAVDKLNRLQQKNDDTAANRLDRSRLEQLAEEQRRLAEEAAKADPAKLKELQDKQKELNDRLAELTKESDALRKAKEEADRQRANELADDLKKLADKQRDLDEAVNKSADAARREQLDELKKLQKELNDKAAKLKDKTDPAARLGDTKPLDRKPFDAAAEKLEQKNSLDAMSEQEKAARELDRLADALADQVKDRGDAKAAAEQIARWQKDLNRRAADAAAQHPNGVPKAERDKLAAEQQAIRKATERLKLPPADGLETARTAAADTADAAAEKVQRDVGKAESSMKKAADALDEQARKTPSNKERNAAAKAEVDKLRREQDKIQQEAEDAAKAVKQNPDDKATRDELAKKLGEAAAKQDELAKKLKQLDTPGQEDRRDRAAKAGERAAGDMKAGLPQDVPASQADAKRQLDRLKDALDGKTPADERAGELARQQNDLTRNLQKSSKPEDVQRLQRQQQDIADQLSKLQAPEAAGELADAQAAAKAAQKEAAKPNPDVDELRKKSKDAADKLDKLADRMGGEPDAQKRLDKIAENRQAEADRAKEAEASRADMSRSREAQKQAERDLNDLNDTRTGQAQAAKKKLQEALDKLNKADEPDKAKDLQQQAADAAKKLADAVKKNGDRKGDGDQKAQKPGQDPADAADPNNALPTPQDVAQARDLAKQQRELKNDVAKAQEKAAKGQPMPQPNGDPLGDLAKQQDELAKQAGELAQQAEQKGDPAGQKAKEAADAARQAAEKMAAGDPAGGQKAGADAAQKMKDAAAAAGDAGTKKKADDLAKKQDELNQKAGQATPGDAQARQQNRQKELAQEAGKMADELAKEAGEGDKGSKGAKGLDKAADGAKEAQKQMEQADRTGQNGKPKDAANARRQAEKALDEAADAARGDGQPQQGEKGGQQPGGKGDQPGGKGDGGKGGQQDGKGGQPAGKGGEQGGKGDGGKGGEQGGKGDGGKGDGGGSGKGDGGGGKGDGGGGAGAKAAEAAKQADGKQKQAQGQMGKGDAKGAGESGKQAADKIQEAADQLAKGEKGDGGGDGGEGGGGQGSKPGQGGGGAPSGDLPSVVRDNLGKSWGDLPGDVKAKITAELKAKYGEDYARVIKLYFEQLAERK